MHIKKKQSGEGIYIQAMLMEIIGFSIVTLYNFTSKYSVMTYLEYPIILMQVYIMLYYVLKFNGIISKPFVSLGALVYFAAVIGFGLEILPKEMLSYSIPFCTPINGFAKITYMYGIIKSANANAVSTTTWIISVLTNVARLFTVYVDSADVKLMINFLVSTVLSFGVLSTALYYKSGASNVDTKKDIKKSNSHQHKD
ncbi:PQ-loop repeat-containing protein 3 [Danaus plexippus plexippus]|uniref:PQ-loop repeat-containing protein 3 n=2 Tax=Danaus plexippus TaxID=13037 RepID=A0A212F9S4_DANPL|nr:PQ-loop repeat-containing protein 3 [Danaus plexippus plexippus]